MMGDPLDMKQIFFTNLQLLGLDAAAEGMDNKIPFNKNMFDLPNKRGSEVVLHFLFEKLNPVMCREEFRHCWPIIDKQQEAQFRRTCNNWLNNISKNEPDSHLPRITGSLFLSPGGDKFIQLLLHFSRYVLQQDIEKLGGKEKDCLRYPELTQQTASYGGPIGNVIQCSMVRNRKFLLEESQIILALNREWKEYATELVKDYRKLTKLAREKDHRIREEIQKATERGAERGSPMVRKRRSTNSYEYDFDPQSIKRAQKVQEVRDLWKQFDDFCSREAAEREVIESIVDKTMNKYKISASDVNIKIPDLLLTECEEEIRKRHVDSNFHHGKLNLISIIQLWNLCLHLYIEKMHQAGIPKFGDEIKSIKDKVHTSHAYLSNTKALKEQISSILPELKESIDYLRDKVDKEVSISRTPQSLRTTSVGMGLMEPSPPVSFTPRENITTPEGAAIKLTPDDLTTPEAVSMITDNITGTIRKGPNSLFQGTPVYAKSVKKNDKLTSKLPKKTKTENSNPRTVDVRGQLHSTPTRKVRPTATYRDLDAVISQPETLVSQYKSLSDRSEHSFNSNRSISSITQTSGTVTPKLSPRSSSGHTTPRNQSVRTLEGSSLLRSPGQRSQGSTPRAIHRSPSDMIADEVMGIGRVMSPVMSGTDAFQTRTEIPRSPIGIEVQTMFREAMSNSPRSGSVRGQGSYNNSLNSSVRSTKSHNDDKHYISNNKNFDYVENSWHEKSNDNEQDRPTIFRRIDTNDGYTSDLELKDNIRLTDYNLPQNRPTSPVGEFLDSYESEGEENVPKIKEKDDRNDVYKRPPSPVAEVLESFGSEEEQKRRPSPVAEVLESYGSEEEDNNPLDDKKEEEEEFYLEQPEDLQTETEEEEQYETLSKKLQEQRAFLTKEMIPRSPLKDEIREMIKEALSDVEQSPFNRSGNRSIVSPLTRTKENSSDSYHNGHHSGFDLDGAGEGLGLDDIEMPDMSFDDYMGDQTTEDRRKSMNKPSAIFKTKLSPELINFDSPKPKKGFNLLESEDIQRLDKAKHDLDEIFSKSLPLRLAHASQSETMQKLEANKQYIDNLEKSIGDIEGEILRLGDNAHHESKDDSDLIDNLDDSFAPLKGGFLVEGGTPKSLSSQSFTSEKTEDDIRARMRQLKEAAARIRSDIKF